MSNSQVPGESQASLDFAQITDRDEAWSAIQDGKVTCQKCGEREATDLHNHRDDPEDWQALCSICHADVESRGVAWTPIGTLAVRYADIVKEINEMKNRIQARTRLDWDAIQSDYQLPLSLLSERRKELKKKLESQAEGHDFWDFYLKDVTGIGPQNGALILAVMERAFAQDITDIRDQRRYFGLVPNGVFEGAENEKYHDACKWLISQALGNCIMMQQGEFGDRYKHYREIVEDKHPDWQNGHQYNATWTRIAREFMKAVNLKWKEWQGEGVGKPHPNDTSPKPEAWCK